MTDDDIRKLARFECWRFKESTDPHHSHTYTFNDSCLIDFARRLLNDDSKCKDCAGLNIGDIAIEASRLADEIERLQNNIVNLELQRDDIRAALVSKG